MHILMKKPRQKYLRVKGENVSGPFCFTTAF